jgi:hypothetical protein
MMEKELEQLLLSKNYFELTPNEKESLREWCATEDEFIQLKQVFDQIEGLKSSNTYSPKKETKQSLDDLFAVKHQRKTRVIWLNGIGVALYPKDKPLYQRPLAYAAAIGIIALIATPFIFDNTLPSKPSLAQVANNNPTQTSNSKTKTTTSKSSEEPPVKVAEMSSSQESNEAMASEPESFSSASEEIIMIESIAPVEVLSSETATMSRSVADESWSHSDGIFMASDMEKDDATASSLVSAHPSVLDLLTATF